MVSSEDDLSSHETNEALDRGKHGKDFELEMSKFLFKRLLDKNFNYFAFTREKSGLGKFDDLVLIYRNGNTKNHSLIQIKHKESENEAKCICYKDLASIRNNDTFSLQKYYNSYTEYIENSIDKDFHDSELEQLVICTNIDFEENLQEISKIGMENEGFFKGSGKIYKLEIPDGYKRKIFKESYLSDVQRLADELILSTMLHINLNIRKYKNDEHISFIKTYHIPLSKHVFDVNKKRFREAFFTSTDTQVAHLRECVLSSFTEYLNKFRNLKLEEQMRILKIEDHFQHLFTENCSYINNANLENVIKSKEKVFKIKAHYSDSEKPESVLKSLHINLSKDFGDEGAYPMDPKDFGLKAMIDEVKVQEKIDKFLNLLTFAVVQNDNKRIIEKELEKELYIKFSDKMKAWYDKGAIAKGQMKKRAWITKNKLLSLAKEYRVTFQGAPVTLSQLVEQESHYSPFILMNVFCSVEIHIGEQISGLKELKRYYITRTLSHKIFSLEDISEVLENSGNDIFLISNVQKVDLKHAGIYRQNVKYIFKHISEDSYFLNGMERKSEGNWMVDSKCCSIFIANDTDERFFDHFLKANSKIIEHRNVHWLKYCNSSFEYIAHWGKNIHLERFFVERFVKEDKLLNMKRFIFICGEPGIGKSTLMRRLPEIIKEQTNKTNHWVLNVIFKDCILYLKELDKFDNLDDVVLFLGKYQNLNSLSLDLLKLFLTKEERLVLILDGFDELFYGNDQAYQRKVLEFLEILKTRSTVHQVVISSRFHYQEILEEKLNTSHFFLQELNDYERKDFLCNYWSINRNDRKKVSFTYHLVDKLIKNVCCHWSFFGNPLHLWMIGEIYKSEIIKEDPIVPDYIPAPDLFEQFLKTKYEVFRKKHGDTDPLKKYVEIIDSQIQNCAILHSGVLFPEEASQFAIDNPSDPHELLDTGIICKKNSQIQFVHKAFAEYLIAKRLINLSYRKPQQHKRDIVKVLSREGGLLLTLFDLILTEKNKSLNTAALRGDINRVLKSTTNEVNTVDCLGRSVLYYSLLYNHSEITSILIDKGLKLTNIDQLLKFALGKSLQNYYRYIMDVDNYDISNHAKLAQFILSLENSCDVDDLTWKYEAHLEENQIYFNSYNNYFGVKALGLPVAQCSYESFEEKSQTLSSDTDSSLMNILSLQKGYLSKLSLNLFIELDNYDKFINENPFPWEFYFHSDILQYEKCHDCIADDCKELLSCSSIDFESIWSSKASDIKSNVGAFHDTCKKVSKYLEIEQFVKVHHIVTLYLKHFLPFTKILDHYYRFIITPSHTLYLSLVIDLLQSRANNMTTITKALFSSNIRCPYYIPKQFAEDAKTFTNINFYFISYYDLSYSFAALKEHLEVNTDLPGCELAAAKDFFEVFTNYKDKVTFRDETKLCDIIASIIEYELERSEALVMIDLFKCLHSSVKENDWDKVFATLEKAKRKGFLEAILNARNVQNESAKDMARNNKFQEIEMVISEYNEF